MVSAGEIRERDFLQALVPGYEAEGFSIFLHPSREMLPSFMHDVRPDAIAIKDDKKIAIEIKRGDNGHSARVPRLQSLISTHPEWELRIYYIPSRFERDKIEAADLPEIDAALAEVDQLKKSGHFRAALMLAWAALEAASRTVLPQNLARPQTADRLIEVLASEGLVTPGEADSLRQTVSMRNAATHGHFAVSVTEDKIDQVVAAATLIKDLAGGATSL